MPMSGHASLAPSKAKTKFALAKMTFEGRDFWFDGNGKVTLDNGTFEEPTANAFSLPHVSDCPGSTSVCEASCYVNRLQEAEPVVYSRYEHNSRAIREVLRDRILTERTAGAFAEWITANAPHGFRWHVSGDLFSPDYAGFVGRVCSVAPSVRFWLYTRSFSFVEFLGAPVNLVVNLSADAENYRVARAMHVALGYRLCYMTVDGSLPTDLPDGSVIFPDYSLRGRELPDPKQAPWWQSLDARARKMVCPPDFFGQSAALRCGPCTKCLY